MPGTPGILDPRESIARATVKAQDDPLRPRYHFHPPAQWMNDPNGTVFHDGRVELFYQYNPYADTFGEMHWGHATSSDYITWRHRPIALTPQGQWREDECWSGCCVVPSSGMPVILYTSVEGRSGGPIPNRIRIARGDADFERWYQEEQEVISADAIPGDVRNDMRDPYVFEHAGAYYLVVGGVLGADERPTILLFRSADSRLLEWEYVGPLYEADGECRFPECPNFFALGDLHVLLVAGMRPVEYHTGRFSRDAPYFNVERSGSVDFSSEFYATNTLMDDRGRTVLFAWIRGFPKGRGWNGCLAIPRVVGLDVDGALVQRPIEEIKRLRQHHFAPGGAALDTETITVGDASVYNLEIKLDFEIRDGAELVVDFANEESVVFRITVGTDVLRAGGINVPVASGRGNPRSLHIFTDRSVVEVFADSGRYCVTRAVDALVTCNRVTITRPDGASVTRLEYWTMGALGFVDDGLSR